MILHINILYFIILYNIINRKDTDRVIKKKYNINIYSVSYTVYT